MTSDDRVVSGVEREMVDLLPQLHARDDEPGPDPAFVHCLEERLLRLDAVSASGPNALDWMAVTPASRPQRRKSPIPAVVARPRGNARIGLVPAVLLVVVLAGAFPIVRLLAPDRPVATLPTIGAPEIPTIRATPAVTEAAFAMERGNPGRTGEVAGSGPRDEPRRLWQSEVLQPGEERQVLGLAGEGVVFAGDTVYLAASLIGEEPDTVLVAAFDAATGTQLWLTWFDGPSYGSSVSSPAIAGDLVYVGATDYPLVVMQGCAIDDAECEPVYLEGADAETTGSLVALDRRTGRERWRVETGGSASSPPVVVDGTVYVGSADGTIVAVDAESGTLVWRKALADLPVAGREAWVGTIAADGRSLYVVAESDGDSATMLSALDATSGEVRWRFAPRSAFVFDPVVRDGVVVVGVHWDAQEGDSSLGGWQILALDAERGTELWRYDGNGTVAAGDGIVYVAGPEGEGTSLVALDARTGEERWSTRGDATNAFQPRVLLANGLVYVSTFEQRLAAIAELRDVAGWLGLGEQIGVRAHDAETGEMRWRVDARSGSEIDLAVGGNALFVLDPSGSSGRGTLTAFGNAR